MIRINCPSCQHPHEFLDLYRGLTIFCKHCKAGILIPKDAESVPDSTSMPTAIPAPMATLPSADVMPGTDTHVAPIPAPMPAPATRYADDDGDVATSRASNSGGNKRTLILAALLGIILIAGGALLAREYFKRNTGVASNNVEKPDPKPEPKPPFEEKKPEDPPKPPTKVEKKPEDPPTKKPETPKVVAKGEVKILEWYTAESVPCVPPTKQRYSLEKAERDAGKVLLVVRARVAGPLLLAKEVDDGWFYRMSIDHFTLQEDKGAKFEPDGLEYEGAFAQIRGKTVVFSEEQSFTTEDEPMHHDVGLLFVVTESAANGNRLSLKLAGAAPPVSLAAATRKKDPDLVENKTPKETPKGKSEPDIEIVSWYAADAIPNSSKGMMQLSGLDQARKYEFVVATVKFPVRAPTKLDKGDGVTVNLFVKDMTVFSDGQKLMNRIGLKRTGGFGDGNAAGYSVIDTAFPLVPKDQSHLVEEIFFTAPKGAAEAGKLTLQYKTSPAVKLDESQQQEAPVVKLPPKEEKKPIVKEVPKVKNEDVEVLEWIVTDSLPGTTPDTKLMTLNAADREAGNIFVAVKVKLSPKAVNAMKEEVRWKIRCEAKDFVLRDGDEENYAGQGLEEKGVYGTALSKSYLVNKDRTVPLVEEPDYWIQGVFFTVPRKIAEAGELELRYRNYPAVTLDKSARKK